MAKATPNRERTLNQPTCGRAAEFWLLVGHYDSEFTSAIYAELDRLSRLPWNWDSYGAPVIDPDIITAARKFIETLPENLASRPKVVPMSTGNLQFEWQHQGKLLELEFETAKTIHYLQWQPKTGVEEEGTFPTSDIDQAVDLLRWFRSGTCG